MSTKTKKAVILVDNLKISGKVYNKGDKVEVSKKDMEALEAHGHAKCSCCDKKKMTKYRTANNKKKKKKASKTKGSKKGCKDC